MLRADSAFYAALPSCKMHLIDSVSCFISDSGWAPPHSPSDQLVSFKIGGVQGFLQEWQRCQNSPTKVQKIKVVLKMHQTHCVVWYFCCRVSPQTCSFHSCNGTKIAPFFTQCSNNIFWGRMLLRIHLAESLTLVQFMVFQSVSKCFSFIVFSSGQGLYCSCFRGKYLTPSAWNRSVTKKS